MNHSQDKHILRTISENPEKGFRLLMARFKEPVYWHIRRLVVSHDDAQDAPHRRRSSASGATSASSRKKRHSRPGFTA